MDTINHMQWIKLVLRDLIVLTNENYMEKKLTDSTKSFAIIKCDRAI
jgi:hypothetical protein